MGDLVDLAVAAASAEPAQTRANGDLALSSGRVVRIDVPVPMSAVEVLELVVGLPGWIGQANAMMAPTAGHIALPDGGMIPVRRDA